MSCQTCKLHFPGRTATLCSILQSESCDKKTAMRQTHAIIHIKPISGMQRIQTPPRISFQCAQNAFQGERLRMFLLQRNGRFIIIARARNLSNVKTHLKQKLVKKRAIDLARRVHAPSWRRQNNKQMLCMMYERLVWPIGRTDDATSLRRPLRWWWWWLAAAAAVAAS